MSLCSIRASIVTLNVIDSHHHFWWTGRHAYSWPPAAADRLARDFTPDDLHPELARCGVEGTVLVPDLALDLPSPTDGGRTYTFRLRRGIHYSNGALVEPADFRRAIERSLAGASAGLGGGFYFSSIAGFGQCLKTPRRCDLSKGIVTDPASNTVA